MQKRVSNVSLALTLVTALLVFACYKTATFEEDPSDTGGNNTDNGTSAGSDADSDSDSDGDSDTDSDSDSDGDSDTDGPRSFRR